jgi:hypothetical protein
VDTTLLDHPKRAKDQNVTAIAGQRARLFSGFISKRNDASMSGSPRASEGLPVDRSFAAHQNKKFPRAAFSCAPTYIGNACLCHPLRRPSAASSSFHRSDRICWRRRRQFYRRTSSKKRNSSRMSKGGADTKSRKGISRHSRYQRKQWRWIAADRLLSSCSGTS